MNLKLILTGASLLCMSAFAKPYIVLFQQVEIAVSSLDHGAFTQLLQTSNQKSVDQLKQWISTRGIRASVGDLWLVRGAQIVLDEDDAKKLAREPWVVGVHEDKVRQMISPTGHTKVASSLKELGETGETLWGLARIGLPKIRAEFPKLNGQGVRVGILDTGIQSNHAELKGRVTVFKDFVNGLSYPYDDQGHGTHAAGTIAGANVGVAPGVSLIVGKVFTAAGSGEDSTILKAMQWIFDPDNNPATADFPKVISNSWGADLPHNGVHNIGEFAAYQLALQAWVHGGITPVFAAGNSGTSPNGIPGGLPEPIAVGAIAVDNQLAEFSSVGPNLWSLGKMVLSVMKPDVSAPGVGITSCVPGNKFAMSDGTSMATPHVAGALALAFQADPKLNFAMAKEALLKASEKKLDVKFGYGILDAYQLVKVVSQ